MKKSALIIFILSVAAYIALSAVVLVHASYNGTASSEASSNFVEMTGIFDEDGAFFHTFGKYVENEDGEGVHPEVEIIGNDFDKLSFTGLMRKFIGHFGVFAAICLFGAVAASMLKRSWIFLIADIVLTFFVALISELIQLSSPERAAQLSDVILDSLGAAMGAIVFIAIYFLVLSIRKKPLPRFSALASIVYTVLITVLFAFFHDKSKSIKVCFIIYSVITLISLTIIAISWAISRKSNKKQII